MGLSMFNLHEGIDPVYKRECSPINPQKAERRNVRADDPARTDRVRWGIYYGRRPAHSAVSDVSQMVGQGFVRGFVRFLFYYL